ncbi:MAG TPA: PA14 domain-containing protein, partial [Verrucomicrobiae bacterium]|nr:PA14 domain-containing protein [Verrucomicrobiae bacterium]
MPDVLHYLTAAEKAEAVEALVHYLISEQAIDDSPGVGAEEFQIQQGRTLYHTIGCTACHEPQAAPNLIPGISPDDPKLERFDPDLRVPASVPLGNLARKTTAAQLAKFLVDPVKSRPSGRMPSFNLTATEAGSMAVYLLRAQAAGLTDPSKRTLISGLKYQYYEESFGSSPDFGAMTPKAAGTADGFEINHRKRDNGFGFRFSGTIKVPKEGRYTFFALSDDGSMLYIDGELVVSNNGDHAPEEKRGTIQLTAGDHSIVTTYYNNGAGFEFKVSWRGPGFEKQSVPGSVLSHYGQPMVPIDHETFAVDREKAKLGRQLFASLGCASCHPMSGEGVASARRAQPLRELAGKTGGCLSERPGQGVPRFDFQGGQRNAIAAALRKAEFFSREANPKEQVAWTLAQLNCFACHTRDGKGGPTDARLAYFRTAGELDMGDEGRIPPHLTEVGAKLRLDWMQEVLMKHGRARPYMATRMPRFSPEAVASLPKAFETADARAENRRAPELTLRAAKFGRHLAGAGGLSCIACHTIGSFKSLGIPAIDLAMMSQRLKYDWFARYVVDPPSLRPGTRMPSFWPAGEAVNKEILNGNTQAQIDAIWAYLSSKPESDLPPGLVQGKMELVPETEPIIYRNFIQGAGPGAIAVGYPEKVNLAFDANNIRMAMIWQGPFIDASRHRSGRGEGYEPPLGNNIVKFPEGPPFAVLQSEQDAWPSTGGREAGFKMGGYTLDEKRRPTFFYNYGGVRVEEAFDPIMGEIDASFKRTFELRGPPVENLWFRAATGQIEKKGDAFILDEKIILKFPGSEAVLRGEKQNRELIVPVRFREQQA